jgi:hypothetical protein
MIFIIQKTDCTIKIIIKCNRKLHKNVFQGIQGFGMMPQLAGTTILGPQFIMQQAANPFSHHIEHQLQQQLQQQQQQIANQKPPQPPSPPRIYEYAYQYDSITKFGL